MCYYFSMYTSIKSEIKNLEKKLFSGHIKFGIEKGSVVSEVLSSNIIYSSDFDFNFNSNLLEIADDNFYGTVEFDLNFGSVINMHWSRTFNGEDLKKRLSENKCKNVKVVVKK